ncbi:cyclase family protein [Alkaliphilus metalliredigens QYMF]|uniref:Cyclase family protein n=1 Tax=Alkaliphilus metalliredigens (strain QYMF) TaxID=293826 RepID=A6TWC3_ALKMQ|nr:cyclase family protein [Alkaliphilus metalliredigens]ABR50491.1 cyclase family protein [Alkaliphilus metalliredigens QYMF]
MIKLIDLSHDIEHHMPVHPYDDPVNLYQDKFLNVDGYNNFKLEMGMHSGTHIDIPMHLTKSEKFINEISLDSFTGRGCLLDVRGEQVIKYKEKYSNIVNENDIVLLFTNHSDQYGTNEYFTNHPVIDEELANFFIEKKIKILGMDLPSPDEHPFRIHKMLLNHNILIIENITNLSKLVAVNHFEVMAFPLKIKAEASMTRVVARVYINPK